MAAPNARTGTAAAPRAGGPAPGGAGRGGPGPMMGPPGLIGTGAKSKDFKRSARRLAGLLAPHRVTIVIVILLAVLSVTLGVMGPKLLGKATDVIFRGVMSQAVTAQVQKTLPPGVAPSSVTIDEAVTRLRAGGQSKLADMFASMHVALGRSVDFTELRRVLLLTALVYLISMSFGWLQQYLTVGISQGIVYKLRNDVAAKLGRLPLSYSDSHPRGDLLSRVTNDIDNIAQTLQQALTQITSSVLTVTGVLVMMFSINWLLALVSLLTVPLSVVVTMRIARQSQKQFAAQWEHTGTLNGHIEEMHTGRNVVKVFGRAARAEQVFDEENQRLYEVGFKAQFISGTIQPAMSVVGNLNYVFIAVVGGMSVASGRLSLGDVQAFIQYTRQFTWPITQLATIANVLQSSVASAERVFELLDEPEQAPDVAEPIRLAKVSGHVELRDVSFRYKADEPLIENFTLDVKPGETIAIVGPTGAGKTTVVNLLMRFYEIDDGAILLDGVDTRQMTREDVRSHFGMVLQDAWLFGGSIRENIGYGCEGATEAQIIAAAEAAHVDHFVRTLPGGYDTRLDDDSANVSQGEKQLLTIARAFLADPDILILDEATSSVDTRTEVLIKRAMARLMKGRTSFVIAHRLSTIRDAHSIVVMDHGRIVEVGDHERLLANRGFYYDLYTSQFAEAVDGAA
jgi:ATP-binding cassette, subfamily B, multidrug efflux pump